MATATIKTNQTGTITFGVDETNKNATLTTPVVMANSVVTFIGESIPFDSITLHEQRRQNFTINLINTNTINFQRQFDAGGDSVLTLTWQVVEYNAGVSVQRSPSTLPLIYIDSDAGPYYTDITISTVDRTKSYVTAQIFGDAGYDETTNFHICAELTSNTNLRISTLWAYDFPCSWQVISIDDATVQSVSAIWDANTGGTYKDITIPSSIDTTKSFVNYFSKFNSYGILTNNLTQTTKILNSTTVRSSRSLNNSSFGMTINIYVVSVSYQKVQRGNIVYGANTSQTATVTSYNSANSFAKMNIYQGVFPSNNSSTEEISRLEASTVAMTNSTTLTFTRNSTDDVYDESTTLDWELVELLQNIIGDLSNMGNKGIYRGLGKGLFRGI